jgi:hypothetical protein
MNIYKLSEMDDIREIVWVNDDDITFERKNFRGQPMQAIWRPIEYKVNVVPKERYDGWKYPPSDVYSGKRVIFSRKAVDALYNLLEANGEILPLIFEGKENEYFAYNVLTVSNAVDEEKSEIHRHPDGDFSYIKRYEFDPTQTAGLTIFKTWENKSPRVPNSHTYVSVEVFVTDPFVKRVQEAGLFGFDFRLKWSGPTADDLLDRARRATPLRASPKTSPAHPQKARRSRSRFAGLFVDASVITEATTHHFVKGRISGAAMPATSGTLNPVRGGNVMGPVLNGADAAGFQSKHSVARQRLSQSAHSGPPTDKTGSGQSRRK